MNNLFFDIDGCIVNRNFELTVPLVNIREKIKEVKKHVRNIGGYLGKKDYTESVLEFLDIL